MAVTNSSTELIVCWHTVAEIPDEATVLSFLSPADEEALRQKHRGTVISAREASQTVRTAAQRLYRDIVAAAGVAGEAEGRTLRQRVGTLSGVSRWWFHPVSFRDCESDPAYDRLIAIATIRQVAGAKSVLRLVGAPADLADVLAGQFEVRTVDTQAARSSIKSFARALLSRVRMVVREARHIRASRSLGREGSFDVALSAFWDWSIRGEGQGGLVDRYFGHLADRLRDQRMRVGSLAWLDMDTEPGKQNRSLAAVLAPLKDRHEVVVLQRELQIRDVIASYGDFSALRGYRSAKKTRAFRQAFIRDGLDYFPLFNVSLLAGFAGSSLPNCELVLKATSRALTRHKPLVFVSFLEHFPHARAQYGAARSAGVTSWIVQHASYCHEKTFLVLDPDREFGSAPDSLACPTADAVSTAGELGRQLFLESGYASQAVAATGSPRYDHVRVGVPRVVSGNASKRILLAASLSVEPELDMIEAVVAATAGRDDLHLVLRNHPFRRLDAEPRYEPHRNRLEISSQSLQSDLEQADLILFTYSTVADEAFLAGKPVWQWLPRGFNGSALAEVGRIPQFSTVQSLRHAFAEAVNTGFGAPDPRNQHEVGRSLFGACDGGAAARVAAAIAAWIRQAAGPATEERHG